MRRTPSLSSRTSESHSRQDSHEDQEQNPAVHQGPDDDCSICASDQKPEQNEEPIDIFHFLRSSTSADKRDASTATVMMSLAMIPGQIHITHSAERTTTATMIHEMALGASFLTTTPDEAG